MISFPTPRKHDQKLTAPSVTAATVNCGVDFEVSALDDLPSLSAFICSPRDTPQGPRGVILFTPAPDHAC